MKNIDDRLINVETKLAYLEDFINKLQEIAVEHSESIERLKQENRMLKTKLGDIEDSVQEIPNIRPPHY
ncbi:MAG TPA: SlyX family protein [Treponemataceae bacterium]|nr:SlyX family protein [Treponemataceae bacterium]